MFYSINGNLKSNKVIETLDILDLDSKILELENLNYTNSKIDSKLEKLINNKYFGDYDEILSTIEEIETEKNTEKTNLSNLVTEFDNLNDNIRTLTSNINSIYQPDSDTGGLSIIDAKINDLNDKIGQASTVSVVNVTSLRKKEYSQMKFYPGPYVLDPCLDDYDKNPAVVAKIFKNKNGKFMIANGIDENGEIDLEGKKGLLINNTGDLVVESIDGATPTLDINGFLFNFDGNKLKITSSNGNYFVEIDEKGKIELNSASPSLKSYYCIGDQTDKDNCLDRNKIKLIKTIANLV